MRLALAVLFAIIVPLALEAQARPRPVGAAPPWMGESPDTLPPEPPPPAPPAPRRAGCSTGAVVATLVGAPVASGAAGWLMGGVGFYTYGLGMMASDHGEEFRRVRRRWLRAGTVIGVGAGVVFGTRYLLEGCPPPAPPEPSPRRRPSARR